MKKIILFVFIFVLISSLFINCGRNRKKMLQIKGSDTLVNLVQILSEEYMIKNRGSIIAVTGGGSGTGIAALIDGRCDIANSSREIKDKELKHAKAKKVNAIGIVIAVDALSVIVNPHNKIDKLTIEEIGKIFRGEIISWKYFGGEDKEIILYGRESNSGTYGFFQEHVLSNKDYYPKMKQMNGNAQIVEAIKADIYGIGYVGVGYVKATQKNGLLKIINVSKQKNGEYFNPNNTEYVKSGKYPIARPLWQFVNGKPQGNILKFISYILSDKGQKIVEEQGFFPIGQQYKDLNKKEAGI